MYKLLLTGFLGLLLGGLSAQPAPTTFGEQMQQKWHNSADYLLETVERMPDSLFDYRPTDDQMSFVQQLRHNLSHMTSFSVRYLEAVPFAGADTIRRAPDSLTLSKAAWLDLARRALDYADAAMAAVPDSAYNDPVKFFAGPMNKQQIIVLLHDHLTHHRGQMLVYLRLCGVEPPKYRGW